MTKLIINLTGGVSVQTQSNVAADLAGLINAATDKIYTCTDLFNGHTTYVVVDQIISFADAPA